MIDKVFLENISLSQLVGWPESLTRYSYLIFTEISKMKFWIENQKQFKYFDSKEFD